MAVVVPILTEFKPKGLQDAEKGIGAFASKAGDKLKKFTGIAAAAGAAVAGAAIVFGKNAVEAASDLGENMSKVGVIFGDASDEVVNFSKTTAKQFGISKNAALTAAGTFGTFGKAAGLSGKKLSTFSNDFTGLAADLASFNNSTPEEAINAIGAALRGESEPIRRFGVLLSDSVLKAKAMELGIYDGVGALTAQQKTLAATQAIFEQTNDAQGDFARTSDGLANQQRILKARFEDVMAQIGEKLLPVASKLAEFFLDKLVPAVEGVIKIFEEEGLAGVLSRLTDWIKEAAPKALDALKNLAASLWEWMRDTGFPTLVEKMKAGVKALTEWIKESFPTLADNLGKWMGKLTAWIISDGIPKLLEVTAKLAVAIVAWLIDVGPSLIEGIGKFFLNLVDGMTKGFRDLGNKMLGWGKDLAKELVNGIIDGWNKLDLKVPTIKGPFGFKFGGFDLIPDIPMLADGGIVTGPTLAMIGERGPEAVVPLDRAGGLNTNVTINVNGGDPNAVVAALRRYMQVNGSVPIRTTAA